MGYHRLSASQREGMIVILSRRFSYNALTALYLQTPFAKWRQRKSCHPWTGPSTSFQVLPTSMLSIIRRSHGLFFPLQAAKA